LFRLAVAEDFRDEGTHPACDSLMIAVHRLSGAVRQDLVSAPGMAVISECAFEETSVPFAEPS
jgi:hypothetical protein